jgi:hypothetical protein
MAEVKPKTNEQLKAKTFNPKSGGVVEDAEGKAFKYNVTGMSYPQDIGTNGEYPHYVVFYINIRGKSQWKDTTYKNSVEVSGAGQNNTDKATLGSRSQDVATVGGGYAGYKVANAGTANLAPNLDPRTKLAISALGVVTGAVVGHEAFKPDKKFRIDSAIVLAINSMPSTTYRVEYKPTDLGSLGGFLAGGSAAVDSTKLSFLGESAKALLLNTMQLPAAISSNVDPKAILALGTSESLNPFREQVFENVETRSFTFEYKFLPRSPAEAKAAQSIIKMFKFHMHPELAKGGLFYIYPSTFDIQYFFNGAENPNINKISECVLAGMKVDYGPQGQMSSFADGSPTEITMSLNFIELEVLTKERVNSGY